MSMGIDIPREIGCPWREAPVVLGDVVHQGPGLKNTGQVDGRPRLANDPRQLSKEVSGRSRYHATRFVPARARGQCMDLQDGAGLWRGFLCNAIPLSHINPLPSLGGPRGLIKGLPGGPKICLAGADANGKPVGPHLLERMPGAHPIRSEEHTSELQSPMY